ncbi:hypothetical protein [Aquibacillus kalidii]|uniref:hypothetical protein n=1 Tax=Aquibacillus kalidii TaxID=2762597 RepID=UPI0016449A39|nr:hypothetical protein [Aquibacillus kalidii]
MEVRNRVSFVMFVLGVVFMLIGAFLGFIVGTNQLFYDLEALQEIVGWSIFATGIISGIIFMAFSEVIILLQAIYNQGKQRVKTENSTKINATENKQYPVPEQARKDIIKYYKDRNVQEIYGTHDEDFFKIKMDDQIHIIELGGFHPVVIPEKKAKELGFSYD